MNCLTRSHVITLLIFLLLTTGCGGNPTLSQPAYEKAMALFSALSRKDEAALTKLQELIADSKSELKISAAEADLLLSVIENAKRGNWESATARMRKLMEKQASVASQTPSGEKPMQRHRH